jgi:FMN phosphatase YigB (HAD superfamily)
VLQAVLFDLDDTLVIADNDALMREYFAKVAAIYAGVVEPKRLQQQIIDSTLHVIRSPDGKSTALEIFADHFFTTLGLPVDMTPFLNFYAGQYNALGRFARPAHAGREAVQAARQLGLRVAVATNPVFPRIAVETRLSWAGLADVPWNLVTTAEEMRYCKPHPQYFREAAEMLGVPAKACLMVGNDPANDLPAAQVGMCTFLVTEEVAAADEALRVFMGGTAQVEAVETLQPDYQGSLSDLSKLLGRLA